VPIYEYRCPNGHVFELFQRMGDEPPAGCETCGAGPLERVLYPVAVHFKGSGFYTTDYGRGSRKPVKEGEGGGGTDASSDTGGADKTEKPVEKTSAETKAAEA
jgi:putative FmdB family regulatory protein